ncbi:hypothetical protein B0H10DRAFT_2213107 [Mycena sp. CBHHK59/15]|nr:hypothetical protein B0H10DRAFT_2213107 [Mycena sp. CBHHK59/15]
MLPILFRYKNCDKCRGLDKNNQAARRAAAKASSTSSTTASRKRRRASLGSADDRPSARLRTDQSSDHDTSPTGAHSDVGSDDDMGVDQEDDPCDSEGAETFSDAENFCEALRADFKSGKAVDFHGTYDIAVDALVAPRDRVRMVAAEIWKIGGYRFIVRDHRKLKSGHRTRFWCSQDAAHKKKSKVSQNPDIRNRDNVGMKRYSCQSKLSISCQRKKDSEELTVNVKLQHAGKHISYVDVSMPPAALDMIRDNVEWLTPVAMVSKVQAVFPDVTAAQIYRAWTEMSEIYWRREDAQLPSATKLLEEHGDDVDLFKPEGVPEGVEMLCWG